MTPTPLPFPDAELSVVGFDGRPVKDGTGLKHPIFLHAPTQQYFVVIREHPRFHSETAIAAYEANGNLTRTSRSWPAVEGGIVLYAAPSFLGRPDDVLLLDSSLLTYDRKIEAWLAYLPRGAALDQLRDWARALLADAHEQLRVAAGQTPELRPAAVERAIDGARRARFCSPPPEHPDLREDAFVCWIAALLLAQRSIEALLLDARLDYPVHTIARLRDVAQQLADGP